jgi:hypothetical protein
MNDTKWSVIKWLGGCFLIPGEILFLKEYENGKIHG